MKSEIEIFKFNVTDIITTSGEEEGLNDQGSGNEGDISHGGTI